MPKDIIIVADSLDGISIGELADYVFCLDGHGASNQAIMVGGADSGGGTNATTGIERARFNDDMATVIHTNSLNTGRRAHGGASNNYDAVMGGGENTTTTHLSSAEKMRIDDTTVVTTMSTSIGLGIRHHHATGNKSNIWFIAGEGTTGLLATSRRIAYDDSGSVVVASNSLNTNRNHAAVAGNGESAIIFEGEDSSGNSIPNNEKVLLADTIAVMVMDKTLPARRSKGDACSNGKEAIIVGGLDPGTALEYDTVEKLRFDDLVDTVTLSTTVTNPGYWMTMSTNSTEGLISGGLSNVRTIGTVVLQRIKFDDYANTIHSNNLSNQVFDAVSVSGY